MAIIVILCGAPHLYKKDMNNSGLNSKEVSTMRLNYRQSRTRYNENLISSIVDTDSSYGSNCSEPVKV